MSGCFFLKHGVYRPTSLSKAQ